MELSKLTHSTIVEHSNTLFLFSSHEFGFLQLLGVNRLVKQPYQTIFEAGQPSRESHLQRCSSAKRQGPLTIFQKEKRGRFQFEPDLESSYVNEVLLSQDRHRLKSVIGTRRGVDQRKSPELRNCDAKSIGHRACLNYESSKL